MKMKIGNIELKRPVVIGPMAGVTTLAYREHMKAFGAGLTVSEMISDCGIDYHNAHTFEYLRTSEAERPVALQLFGSSIESSVKAVGIMEKSATYDILDLNFGCPVPKVTKTGAGSAWLLNPAGLKKYTKAIVEASSKPVTAKIRLGWDEDSINVFEISHLLEEAGVAAIAVHCRTKAQGYAGKARYELIKGLQDELKIPLIVSGDIFTAEDAIKAREITNCQGIMVARGGLGNPFLVTQINALWNGKEALPNPSIREQVAYAKDLTDRLIDLKGEYIGVRELRGHLPHFFRNVTGIKAIRVRLAGVSTKAQIYEIFESIVERL